MKEISLALFLAVGMVALPKVSVYAQTPTPCVGPTATSKCTVRVPEPSSFSQLAAGLLAIGGLAFILKRKRLAQN
jgi:hypothetical protein